MIKILLRVDRLDINTKGRDTAFIEALSEWKILPWVRFLHDHGKLVSVDQYKEAVTYSDTFTLIWELSPEKETWFYLQFGSDYDQIRRLT